MASKGRKRKRLETLRERLPGADLELEHLQKYADRIGMPVIVERSATKLARFIFRWTSGMTAATSFDRGRCLIRGYELGLRAVTEDCVSDERRIQLSKRGIITDGFGSAWPIRCPECGKDEMQIVRPGKVQCGNCG